MITIIHQEGAAIHQSQDASRLPALLHDGTHPFWLDMEAPTEEEFALLRDVFDFHPLSVEDAMNPRQRPKVDEYPGYAYFAADAVILNLDALDKHVADDERKILTANQISLFLGTHYLVSIHIAPIPMITDLRHLCKQNHRIFERGVDYLLYTLFDVLVDSYFPLLDELNEHMDALEDKIVVRPTPDTLETIFVLKRVTVRLRKYVGPLRDVLQTLLTRAFPGIQEQTLPYLRDVDDHLFRIYEALDLHRDLASNMLDAYLSQVSNEMNRTMQKLSAVSILFLPLTFMTGFFGMNFEKMPWAGTNPVMWLAVMGGVAGGMMWWFNKRRWM